MTTTTITPLSTTRNPTKRKSMKRSRPRSFSSCNNNASSTTSSKLPASSTSTLLTTFSILSTIAAAQSSWENADCPPSPFEGWMAAPDCKSYYWCNGGKRGSLDYNCPSDQVFNTQIKKCQASYDGKCPELEEVQEVEETDDYIGLDMGYGDGSHRYEDEAAQEEQQQQQQEGEDQQQPGPYYQNANITAFISNPDIEFIEGPPIYYADVPTTSCKSIKDDNGVSKPEWMTEAHMFTLKQECCHSNFAWMAIESCLGVGFVEMNYLVIDPFAPTTSPSLAPSLSTSPTRYPTQSPTVSIAPTTLPTTAPTSSAAPSRLYQPTSSPTTSAKPSASPTEKPVKGPSAMPSSQPSLAPSSMPSTGEPTESPTTAVPTASPSGTPTSSPVRVNFVVERIGDASSNVGGVTQFSNYYLRPPGGTGSSLGSDGSDTTSSFADGFASTTNNNNNNDSPSEEQGNNNQDLISELIIPITGDATISQQRPSLNFGTNPALAVDAGDANDITNIYMERFDTLLQFDLSLVDGERMLESAVLDLYSMRDCAFGGAFYYMPSSGGYASWDQRSVTWDNAPVPFNRDRVATLEQVTREEWNHVDLTSAVSSSSTSSSSGDHNNIITIRIQASPSSTDRCLYSSKENNEVSHVPKLIVKYAPSASQEQGQEEEITTMTSGGMENTLPMNDIQSIIMSSGDFTLLRAKDDATIDAVRPTSSFGDVPVLTHQFDSTDRSITDILIRFDLRELLENNLPISSAVLMLFAEESCASAGSILATTTSGTASSASTTTSSSSSSSGSWSQNEITWSNAPTTQNAIAIGTFGAIDALFWHGFDVVEAVKMAVQAKKEEITLRMSSNVAEPCTFSSIESGRAPKIMVAFA